MLENVLNDIEFPVLTAFQSCILDCSAVQAKAVFFCFDHMSLTLTISGSSIQTAGGPTMHIKSLGYIAHAPYALHACNVRN